MIVQSDFFNESPIGTVLAVVLTANVWTAGAPGNVRVPGSAVGLTKDSVINVSQVVTLDRTFLVEQVGVLPARFQTQVDKGLRMVLQL